MHDLSAALRCGRRLQDKDRPVRIWDPHHSGDHSPDDLAFKRQLGWLSIFPVQTMEDDTIGGDLPLKFRATVVS